MVCGARASHSLAGTETASTMATPARISAIITITAAGARGMRRRCSPSAAGELHLQGMDTIVRSTVVAGDVAALEPSVGDARKGRRITNVLDCRGQCWRATRTAMGAQIEVRQFAIKESWDARTD